MVQNIIHLLIVDDDDRIRKLLKKYLEENSFLISAASNAHEAIKLTQEYEFDLLILDVMMPEINGYDLANLIRKTSFVPIIMLTALGEINDKINGFQSGIDDYLVKPFEPQELLLRIHSILNRVKFTNKNSGKITYFGDFTYDISNHRLARDNEIITLTASESKLLSILIENEAIALSREKLAKLCGNINERSIDVQIIRLRNKIEINPKKPYFLQTVRGAGYAFYS